MKGSCLQDHHNGVTRGKDSEGKIKEEKEINHGEGPMALQMQSLAAPNCISR